MLLIIFLFLILILSSFITPLIWCSLGKLFRIEGLTLKKALLTFLLLIPIAIIAEIITLGLTCLKLNNVLFSIIFSITLLVLIIYILKVRFKTTILKAIGLYFSSIVFAVCLALLIRTYIVQAFKIPSESIKPTILNGDHILINKLSYLVDEPNQGDLVVFPGPEDPSKDFLKRIIGVEGDKIEIKKGVLFVNDNKVQIKKIGKYNDDSTKNVEEYLESIGKNNYHILNENNFNDNFGPITVPENSLFVLGDNRDNSMDSRHWGFVDETTIKGKALLIYWSWDPKKNLVRWERIGNSLSTK
jgi:signal peptidase I